MQESSRDKADRPTSETIQALRAILCSEEAPLARRFRALFSLKHIAAAPPTSIDDYSPAEAVRAIAAAFGTPSDLLKHELAYCLGQTGNPASAPFLRARLEDANEAAICRHEAAEALAALGDMDSLQLLRQMRDDQEQEIVVRETCDIAVARLEWQQSEERKHQVLRERYV
jgi:deoxyhypusine monooxygenase